MDLFCYSHNMYIVWRKNKQESQLISSMDRKNKDNKYVSFWIYKIECLLSIRRISKGINVSIAKTDQKIILEILVTNVL